MNLVTENCYIGSTVNFYGRKYTHFDALRKGRHTNKHLQSSFNKHGAQNFEFIILEQVGDKTKLIEREQHYLDELKPKYNIRKIARSNLGVRLSEQAKQKLRIFWLGKKRPRTPEHTANLTKALVGNNRGRKKPVGFGTRLSEQRKGKNNPAFGKPSARRRTIVATNMITNKKIEYHSLTNVIKTVGNKNAIIDCLQERRDHAIGYIWEYKDTRAKKELVKLFL